MARRYPLFMALMALALCLAAAPAMAQSEKGSIQVQVVAPDGQPLPGVEVTLTANAAAPFRRTYVSDPGGAVHFVGLPPGIYELRLIFTGFQTVVRPNIQVGVGADLRLTLTMLPATR